MLTILAPLDLDKILSNISFDEGPKFKIGDKVNCNRTDEGFIGWQNATVIKNDVSGLYAVECTCDAYPGETGLFKESELDLSDGH